MTATNLPRYTAYVLFTGCLLGALALHVVPALLAGLLAFVLTQALLTQLKRYAVPRKLLTHELLAAVVVGAGSLAVLGGISLAVAKLLGGESLSAFIITIADTISQAKKYLPEAISSSIPNSVLELKELAAHTLKSHANSVAIGGVHMLHLLVLTLVGWIVGVLAAVRNADAHAGDEQPWANTWFKLWARLAGAFQNVALAQAKIAALNATLTGVFILFVMPLFGWQIPYGKTLVLVTFLAGLVPVVGNLISNTLITVLALSVAFPAAISALTFLIVVHKLEYFISARIQGHEIGAQAWELLIVLFAFETLFGPAGMVAAPVVYAFAKQELKEAQWI